MNSSSIREILCHKYGISTPIYGPRFKIHYRSYWFRLHIDMTKQESFEILLNSILSDLFDDQYHAIITMSIDDLNQVIGELSNYNGKILSSYEDTMDYLKEQEQIMPDYNQIVAEINLPTQTGRIKFVSKVNENYHISMIYIGNKVNDIVYMYDSGIDVICFDGKKRENMIKKYSNYISRGL